MLRLLLAFAAATLGFTLHAHAGGFAITSVGSRRTGMGANVGSPDDATAIVHNVAGLADQQGRRFHLSGGARFFELTFEMQALDRQRFPEVNPDGCEEYDSCPWPVGEDGLYQQSIEPERHFGFAPFLAASTDLSFVAPRRDDVVVGLALHSPNFYGAALPKDAPSSYQVIDGMFMVGALSGAVGWRVNPKLAVGATVAYHHMRMTASRRMSIVDALTPAGEEPDLVAELAQTAMGDLTYEFNGVDHGIGWSGAVLLSPTPWINFGLQYSGATQPEFAGDIVFAYADPYGKSQEISETVRTAGYKLPETLEMEMAYPHAVYAGVTVAPASWLEVGFDFRYWFYQAYKEQRLTPGYDPSEEGDEPFTADDLSSDKDYSSSYDVALGLLVRPLDNVALDLMTGCGYDKSPIPDHTFALDNPAMSSIYCSAGARYRSKGSWRVAASYILVDFIDRHITNSENSPPSNGHGRGRSHIPTVEMEYVF